MSSHPKVVLAVRAPPSEKIARLMKAMKRKLDERDLTTPTPKILGSNGRLDDFASYGLDARILQTLVKEQYVKPTPVQEKAIPLALEGKDIFARAKTGSGKTAAYLLPIIQSILSRKVGTDSSSYTSALVLVPTRELAEQVLKAVTSFTVYCTKEVRALNLTHKVSDAVQRSLLADSPDIVIATPARASLNLNNASLSLERLAHLVIDEADLVLSYGYDEDVRNVAEAIPKGVQAFLMSATLTDEVNTLKGLFCRDPVVLDLEEREDAAGGVSQFVVRCAEDEKFLLIFVIFKLKLIKGKCIVFVGDIDRCYRLKLFLEQFGIKACVLNSELPVNSRIHVVEEFNKNVYDIIIATDEHEVLGTRKEGRSHRAKRTEEQGVVNADDDGTPDEDMGEEEARTDKSNKEHLGPAKKRRQHKKDKEYGISRGIDFKNVACVLNFDLPTSPISYTHRIGRTARAGNTGMALSFVVPKELYRKHKPTSFPSAQHDEEVLDTITQQQRKRKQEIKPYHFDMKHVEAFRYRMEDALRAVTRLAIREARTREIRQELLKSEKLKRHFEENPADLHHLRHDGDLLRATAAQRVHSHLKHIPDYLLPPDRRKGLLTTSSSSFSSADRSGGAQIGFVGLSKPNENRIRKARRARGGGGAQGRGGGSRRIDPLKSFRGGSGRKKS